ncbi:MAG: DUF5053 domain-containing protein [Muribaculaceae bacterium]|nr:DUF5053 domain-containing protein [Muribaculaceae bacterium]
MYLGKRKIFNPEKHEIIRKEVITDKCGATWNAFIELEGLINKSQLAQQYFEKSHGWLSQRLHGCTVRKKSMSFKEEEYHELAEAFRHIAMRLNAHADEIDSATMESADSMR